MTVKLFVHNDHPLEGSRRIEVQNRVNVKTLIMITAALAVILLIFSTRAFAGDQIGFGAARDWTGGPYYGTLGTFFADVDDDGKADAIVVNDYGITVRRSDGSRFLPNEDWTGGPYYGTLGTFFADVDGNRRADAIAVNNDAITVRPSWGYFSSPEDWTRGPYYGDLGTFFADVYGVGRVSAIAVNKDA